MFVCVCQRDGKPHIVDFETKRDYFTHCKEYITKGLEYNLNTFSVDALPNGMCSKCLDNIEDLYKTHNENWKKLNCRIDAPLNHSHWKNRGSRARILQVFWRNKDGGRALLNKIRRY